MPVITPQSTNATRYLLLATRYMLLAIYYLRARGEHAGGHLNPLYVSAHV